MESSILTLLIFIPVAGAVLMLPFAKLYGKENVHYYKWIAAITTGIQLALALIYTSHLRSFFHKRCI